MEVDAAREADFKETCMKNQLDPILLGEVTADPGFTVNHDGESVIVQFVSNLEEAWLNGLAEKLK